MAIKAKEETRTLFKNSVKSIVHFSHGLIKQADDLLALAVPLVDLLAGRARSASSSTGVAATTALSPLSNGARRASSRGRSGLSAGSESGCNGSSSSRGCSGRCGGCGGSGSVRSGSVGGGGIGAGGGAGAGAVPNTGTGDGVAAEAGVDVKEDTGIVGRVSAGEGNAGGESSGSGALDGDVDTLHVELGTTLAVTLVESDDLGAKDVVAGSEVGEGHLVLALGASVGTSNELVDSPLAAVVTVLPDLSPGVRRASLRGVDHDRTLVGGVDDVVGGIVGVVVPLESDLVTALNGDGLGSLDASDVALHIAGGDVEDGAVAWGRVDVTALDVTETGILSVDSDAEDGGVGRGELTGSRKSEGSGELHCELVGIGW